MKVKIGNYKTWIGPYHIVKPLKYLGVNDHIREIIAEKLPIAPFEWLDSKRKRKIKVRIDKYDTWGMDHTLALIILPMLKQLRDTKHGSPFVEDIDVPGHLWCESAEDERFHQKWEWVLNEMIWAFESIIEGGEDDDGNSFEYYDRQKRGLILFGKYYRGLWD